MLLGLLLDKYVVAGDVESEESLLGGGGGEEAGAASAYVDPEDPGPADVAPLPALEFRARLRPLPRLPRPEDDPKPSCIHAPSSSPPLLADPCRDDVVLDEEEAGAAVDGGRDEAEDGRSLPADGYLFPLPPPPA